MLQRQYLAVFFVSALSLSFGAAAQTDVLTYHNDNMRTGQNLSESALTPGTVKSSSFGKLFNISVNGKVDAQPLIVSGLTIPGQGAHNVLFAATEHDSLYAIDADTGTIFWQVSMLRNGETPSDARNCNQVTPEIGITGTPAIDRGAGPHGTIYLVAMSKDSSGKYYQRLHALDLTTGAEQFGGPVDVVATYPGTGDNSSNGRVVFDPKQYKERAGLLLVNGVVYTNWTSHCDIRPYTGWTIGYDQTTLAQTSVLNFAPNGNEASIWAGSGGAAAADSAGNLFFSMANGTFDTALDARGFPANGDYGNAFVRVSTANRVLSATDYWTMFNTVAESNADQDLGSGGVMLIPDVIDSTGATRHLGVGAGKDRNLYLFDRDNMGKFNPNNNGNLYQELNATLSGGEFGNPAWFNGTVYFGAVGDVIRAYSMTAARLAKSPSSATSVSFTYPGTNPSISASGNVNGIVWAVQNTSPAVLHAFDANDLVTEFYNSSQAGNGRDQFGAGNKFITPTIANGKVYVGTPNSVAVFGLFTPSISSITPSSGAQGTAVNVTIAGSNFSAGATVGISGTGVTPGNVSVVSASQITATFTIGATAALGSYNVTVSTGSGSSAASPFSVTSSGTQTPTLASISPSSGTQGASVNVTLTGTNFTPQSGIRLSGLGASFSNVTVLSSTQITATFKLASNAATGVHNVYVVTAAGNSNILPFTVNSQQQNNAPTLTSVSPGGGVQGTAVNVTLTGANFTAGAAVGLSGSGVSVSNVVVVSATQITAAFTISSTAATGSYNVSVRTAAGTSNTSAFVVSAPASQAPTLTSISPSGGTRGTSVNVTLTGTNFTPQASIRLSGLGASFGNVVVVSATQITATFKLASSTATGAHNVYVVTAAGNSNILQFTVN